MTTRPEIRTDEANDPLHCPTGHGSHYLSLSENGVLSCFRCGFTTAPPEPVPLPDIVVDCTTRWQRYPSGSTSALCRHICIWAPSLAEAFETYAREHAEALARPCEVCGRTVAECESPFTDLCREPEMCPRCGRSRRDCTDLYTTSCASFAAWRADGSAERVTTLQEYEAAV